MRGQVNSALRYLSDDQGGGILPLSDDVMEQLKEKHPEPLGVQLGSLLFDLLRTFLTLCTMRSMETWSGTPL